VGRVFESSQRQILRFNQSGKLTDALVMPKAMTRPRGFYLQTADGGNYNFLATSGSASLRSGGYVFGNGDVFRLIIHPSSGPTRVVERPVTNLPLGAGERAKMKTSFACTPFRARNSGPSISARNRSSIHHK